MVKKIGQLTPYGRTKSGMTQQEKEKKFKEIESKSGEMYLLGDPKDPHVRRKEKTRQFEKRRANMSKEIKESLGLKGGGSVRLARKGGGRAYGKNS